jgi:hypothetical protein
MLTKVYCKECRHHGNRWGDNSDCCFAIKSIGYSDNPIRREKYEIEVSPHIENKDNNCSYYQRKRLIDYIPLLNIRHWRL